MRVTYLVAASVLLLAFSRLSADYDYLTKDGELAQPVKIVQLQGGFAGNTGLRWSIAVDGAWSAESLFNQKSTPKDKGKLSKADLKSLAAILDKYEVGELPRETGKRPGANPHTVTIEFGNRISTYVGQTPPKYNEQKPTDAVESRIAGTLKEVVGLLKGKTKAE